MNIHLLPILFALIFLLSSCGAAQSENHPSESVLSQGTTVLPQNSSEKMILEKVPKAAVGKNITAGKYSFIVTGEYFAASGRVCKSLEIKQPASKQAELKTVCDFEGQWGYTPAVVPTIAGQ